MKTYKAGDKITLRSKAFPEVVLPEATVVEHYTSGWGIKFPGARRDNFFYKESWEPVPGLLKPGLYVAKDFSRLLLTANIARVYGDGVAKWDSGEAVPDTVTLVPLVVDPEWSE